jgi:hypothetical protein
MDDMHSMDVTHGDYKAANIVVATGTSGQVASASTTDVGSAQYMHGKDTVPCG